MRFEKIKLVLIGLLSTKSEAGITMTKRKMREIRRRRRRRRRKKRC